jgi:hypothetical protein
MEVMEHHESMMILGWFRHAASEVDYASDFFGGEGHRVPP